MSNIPKTFLFSAVCLYLAACICGGKVTAEEVATKEAAATTAQDSWQTKVVAPMQTAQTLLLEPKQASTASSSQVEALAELDAIIADLTKRQSQCKASPCKGSSCKNGQCKEKQCEGNQCKKPGSPKAGSKPGMSSITGEIDVKTPAIAAGDLVKDLWGKLPERQRQQILQPLNEKFLPKYASEIEAYFRILADPNRSSGKLQ